MNFRSFVEDIKADVRSNSGNSKGLFIVISYRIAHFCYYIGNRHVLFRFILIPVMIFYKFLIDYVMGVYIPAEAAIGRGLVVYHGFGLVVHPSAVIGEYCTLRQGVTIGSRDGTEKSVPRIGSGVSVGAMTVIIGDITVGDQVTIGACSLVHRSVSSGSTVFGNPATSKSDRLIP